MLIQNSVPDRPLCATCFSRRGINSFHTSQVLNYNLLFLGSRVCVNQKAITDTSCWSAEKHLCDLKALPTSKLLGIGLIHLEALDTGLAFLSHTLNILAVLLQHMPKGNWPSEFLTGKQYVQILGRTNYFQLTNEILYYIKAFFTRGTIIQQVIMKAREATDNKQGHVRRQTVFLSEEMENGY